MTRAALLVAVLAALCYTSQAIPVQTENVQIELPNEIVDRLNEMKEKAKDILNKIKDRIGSFENELQVIKFNDASRLQEYIESLKKLLAEGKINAREFVERIRGKKQEIETDYQLSLSFSTKLLKPLMKIIGSQIAAELAPMVKNKVQEWWNNRQSETYGTKDSLKKILEDVQKKSREMADEFVKNLVQQISDLIEKGIKTGQDVAGEVEKILKELRKISERMVGDAKDNLEKIIREIEESLKEMKDKVMGEKYQQPQQAVLPEILGGVGNAVKGIGKGARGIIDATGKLVEGILNDVGDLLNSPKAITDKLKGEKKPEDGKKTDKSEEKENNEVSEKED